MNEEDFDYNGYDSREPDAEVASVCLVCGGFLFVVALVVGSLL